MSKKNLDRNVVEEMLSACGFTNIKFLDNTPYWVCLSYKA